MDQHLTDKLISGYLDGLIPDSEMDSVRHHVARCPQCAERLAQFSLLDETLADMDPQSVDDAVFRQVRTHVLREAAYEDRTTGRAPFTWWLNLFSTRALAYASVVLLIGSALLFTFNRSDRYRGEPENWMTPLVTDASSAERVPPGQIELYRLATKFVSDKAKTTQDTASEKVKSLRDGILTERVALLTEKSSVFMDSAKSKASQLTETVETQGSLVLDAAAKQAAPQLGLAAGVTLLQLLGTIA
ncbi:MAG: zf-HC2 domain-containing protein [bacterium]